jgi:alpha-L-fucosidase
MGLIWKAILIINLLSCGSLQAADPGNSNLPSTNSMADADLRIAQWNEMRFGMLIHWGLYSQWGCHYPGTNGQLINGGTEQMMRHLKIPLAQYAKIADVFDPTNFNAAEWVRIARDGGMKYVIITAKHHDGFAMYDSECSDYNIVKRTPWHRDPIRQLADACRKEGLKFGVYYSLGRDWEDPDAGTRGGYRSNTWDFPAETNKVFARYFERKVKPQLTELLTHYGPISVVWFDTPEEIPMAESREIAAMIHKLQPDCVFNTRVGHHLGDYETLEQLAPNGPMDHPWETCLPLNNHWAYFLGDEDWKPASLVIHDLVNITSKGGNCLLGIGPTGQGVIPAGAVSDLEQIGAWLKTNGESIYGTTDQLVENQPGWGCIIKRNNKFYLHIFDWPKDGKLTVPDLGPQFETATFLADQNHTPLKMDTGLPGNATLIHLPAQPFDPIDTVIAMTPR